MKPSEPIAVLYCENNVDGTIGGSYYSLLYLVKGLDRSRYKPIVVFRAAHSLLPAFREVAETHVWPSVQSLTFATRFAESTHVLWTPARTAQRALNFVRGFLIPALSRAWFLRARDVRIVHLNNSILCNHDWMLAAKLARTKCVTHERGINDVYSTASKYFGRRLDGVICISDAVRKQMKQRGADFGNLVTIYNGLDPSALQTQRAPGELRAALGLEADAPVVVMLGNIKAWKGQDTLIRAVDKVRRSNPKIRCLLVGDTSPMDRDYAATVRALVVALGLEKHVIFTGFQPNVADFIMLSDLIVHASVLPEPFGRVVLEAMAFKKPVVASRGGAIPEIVDEGETGVTFPPGDADALAECLLKVIRDRDQAQRLGENGFDRLVRKFHIDRNVDLTVRLYDRLLRASP